MCIGIRRVWISYLCCAVSEMHLVAAYNQFHSSIFYPNINNKNKNNDSLPMAFISNASPKHPEWDPGRMDTEVEKICWTRSSLRTAGTGRGRMVQLHRLVGSSSTQCSCRPQDLCREPALE